MLSWPGSAVSAGVWLQQLGLLAAQRNGIRRILAADLIGGGDLRHGLLHGGWQRLRSLNHGGFHRLAADAGGNGR